eukprot:769660-Pyramimonas_sp.AAC.1
MTGEDLLFKQKRILRNCEVVVQGYHVPGRTRGPTKKVDESTVLFLAMLLCDPENPDGRKFGPRRSFADWEAKIEAFNGRTKKPGNRCHFYSFFDQMTQAKN